MRAIAALLALLVAVPPVFADALICPLYQDVAVPTWRRDCEVPVRKLCARICRRFPGIAFCRTCWSGACSPPLPTLIE